MNMKLSGLFFSMLAVSFRLLRAQEIPLLCSNGTFSPDPNKYYEIAHPNGLVWTYPRNDLVSTEFFSNFISQEVFVQLRNDPTINLAHWRFTSGGSGKWSFINRFHGQRIVAAQRILNNQFQANVDVLTTRPSVSISNPATAMHSIQCVDADNKNSTATVKIRIGTSNAQISCGSNCAKNDFIAVKFPSQELIWTIREITSFRRADITSTNFTLTPQDSASASFGTALTLVVTGAEALIGGRASPASAGVFAIGFVVINALLDLFIPEEDRLQALADDILRITDKIVESQIAGNDARQFGDGLNSVRNWFLDTTYPQEKEDFINDTKLLTQLAGDAKVKADALQEDIDKTFGFTFRSDLASLAIDRLGFDLYKQAMIEYLLYLQEATLLGVYANPNNDLFTCDRAINRNGLVVKANRFRDNLIATKDGLIKARLAGVDVSVQQQARILVRFDVSMKDPFINKTYLQGAPLTTAQKDAHVRVLNPLHNNYRGELEHDMTQFSYLIAQEVVFFENFANNTLQICNDIQNNLEDRRLFETNAKTLAPVAAVCYPEGSICSQSSHCCEGLTKSADNKCRPIASAGAGAGRKLRGGTSGKPAENE